MLPFLNKKAAVSSIISRRGKSDFEAKPEVEIGEQVNPDLKEAASDMLRAFESKSVVDLAKALESAFKICESYGEEGSELELEREGE